MASTSRGGSSGRQSVDEPPVNFASTPPPQNPMMNHSFTLQAIMDLKGTVSTLVAKVDRLIEDVGKQDEKLDTVRGQITFVKGALWVIGILWIIAVAGIPFYLKVLGK
jgi:hypothetical protein